MKKLIFLGAIFVLLNASLLEAQRILTVSPSAGFPGRFTSLQVALDSAQVGDIIMVSGGQGYSNATVRKKVTIIGPGYFLANNAETQANFTAAYFPGLIFEQSAGGSFITGIEIGSTEVYSAGIKFIRNRIRGVIQLFSTANDLEFRQNYFDQNSGVGVTSGSGGIRSNINFYNNYFADRPFVGGGLDACAGTIENNVFNRRADNLDFSNKTFRNNIFIIGTISSNPQNSFFFNNIFTGSFSAGINIAGSGNQFNVPFAGIFNADPAASIDARFQLSANSPARSAGLAGVDCGMFGGADPYVLPGIPSGPHIYELDVENYGTSQGGLKVKIKAKIKP